MLYLKKRKNQTADPDQWPTPPLGLMEYGESSEAHLKGGADLHKVMSNACASIGYSLIDAPRVLDFGCNNGRVTRWFERSEEREIWGCDIQADKVFWAVDHLSPPLRFFVNSSQPHIPFSDNYFEFICAISIFTHLKESHAAWLLELLRITAPGGILFITLHDEHGFALAEADRVKAKYFSELGQLPVTMDQIEYAAVNDYLDGALAQVYMTSSHLQRLLPPHIHIAGTWLRTWHTQTGYLLQKSR